MPVAEVELGERVRHGDAEAFGALYQEYAPGIYDYLIRLVRQPAAAEDLTQTTFVRAFEERTALRDPTKLRSWLWSTAHNLAMNQLTRTRASASIDEELELVAAAAGPEESVIARESAELVWLAAASLEPRQYAVLDLTVRRDLSTQEVAETLGVPVAHAAVLVHRAKEALGNAVRYLLVARRRDDCKQLAALVPAGVRALTAEQRSAVDHHMRRCETCRQLGDRLTAPAELLGALVLVPLPPRLAKIDWSRIVAGRAAKAGRLARHSAQTAGQHGITAFQIVVALTVAVAVAVPQSGSASTSPNSPSSLNSPSPLGGRAGVGASTSLPPCGGGSGRGVPCTQSLIAIVDPAPASPGFGSPFSTQTMTVSLYRPDGTLANSFPLKPGVEILTAAGPRLFLLERGGVLKGVTAAGAVEDLGNLGTDVPLGFVASPDGTQWMWGTQDSAPPTNLVSPIPIQSSLHAAGIGLAPRTIEHESNDYQVLEGWSWSATGPIVAQHTVCCGLGGGPVAFGRYYAFPDHRIDPANGLKTPLSGRSVCRSGDVPAGGAVVCGTGGHNTLTATLVSGKVVPVQLPPWVWQIGEVYFSPKAATFTVAAVGEPGAGPLIFSRYETYLVNSETGSVASVGLSGVLPAMWWQYQSSWLPDGSLALFRQNGASGGDPGTYVVDPAGKILKITSNGLPVGLLQYSGPLNAGYATAAEAAKAAMDAFLPKIGQGCTGTIGKPTLGSNAAYFQGGGGCGASGFAVLTYVYKDADGWHYLDARGTQANFLPMVGQTGTLHVTTCVRVRDAPSLSGRIMECLGSGSTVKVDGGPNYADQKIWWHIQGKGWMAHDFLICASDATPGLLPRDC